MQRQTEAGLRQTVLELQQRCAVLHEQGSCHTPSGSNSDLAACCLYCDAPSLPTVGKHAASVCIARGTWQAVLPMDVATFKVEPKWCKVTHDRLAWTQLVATVCTWHLVSD